MTISPTSPTKGWPESSQDSNATPSTGRDSSPAQIGQFGADPAKPLTTSVPPLVEASCTRSPTASRTHGKQLAGTGAPVAPIVRSAVRSNSLPGSIPAFIPARKIPGLTPSTLAFVSAAISHSRPGPG